MLPDQVSNPGPLTYESGALPIALRGPATLLEQTEKSLLLLLCRKQSRSKSNWPYWTAKFREISVKFCVGK